MRLGTIIKIIGDKKFGFIRTDHFRDDVFFHQSSLKGLQFRDLEEGMNVEFEIDELLRMDQQKLEATVVQASTRPFSKSLADAPNPEQLAAHHPRARQRKPTWRKKEQSEGSASSPQTDLNETDATQADATHPDSTHPDSSQSET